ncbi:hypothetical protein Mal52_29510 [Symmachiella dynata]|uniref:DUF2306 domain-containing protein n=1 Tax=Symmachiella dynata TaxID=2527995 RepID=A0A517ZPQ1_9PLAN|nr:DUF2306 domain-containing protein [Symmachiella dynata]QDU44469.1 hypothetical protein Mal52_29510 [Symmachiella dynata]
MPNLSTITLRRLLTGLTCLLIAKVVVLTLVSYRDYVPPDFHADFLFGREPYFYGSYAWAFYVHIFAGPVTLVLGVILLSNRFRLRFPRWHRILGRVQAVCVLFFLAPSGLWMARWAMTGAMAGSSFAMLSIATGLCVALGWRAAVQRRFAVHQRWMQRCFVLLCSAVVIRVMGGLTIVTAADAPWIYPLSSWLSWTVPLLIYETLRPRKPTMPRDPETPIAKDETGTVARATG